MHDNDHGPRCLEAIAGIAPYTDMCDSCRADQAAEMYASGYVSGDRELMQAVVTACESDDRLRERLGLVMDAIDAPQGASVKDRHRAMLGA